MKVQSDREYLWGVTGQGEGTCSLASSETMLPATKSNFYKLNVPSVGFIVHSDKGRANGSGVHLTQ